MLTCPKCNYQNELGRIFCHQCGTKLDLEAIKPPSRGGPKIRRRGDWTTEKLMRLAVEIIVVSLVVWVIWLAASVPDVKFPRPTNAELLDADTKRMNLQQLIDRNRAGTVELTEAQVNAFLGSFSHGKPAGKYLEIVPTAIRVTLNEGTVNVESLGDLHIGPSLRKKVYLSCAGVPAVQDGDFDFRPAGAAFGKLPIHPVLLEATDFIQSYFRKLFGRLGNEKSLLDKLSSIAVKPQLAVLTYQPVAPESSKTSAATKPAQPAAATH
jgi:hypothetical protein